GLAGRECGVEAAERSPLFVNIENSRKLGLNIRVTSSDHGDRVRNRGEGGRNALDESLPAEHKLRLVNAHSARCSTGEDETLKRLHGDLISARCRSASRKQRRARYHGAEFRARRNDSTKAPATGASKNP